MRRTTPLLTTLLLSLAVVLIGQNGDNSSEQIYGQSVILPERTTEKMLIDGALNESVWTNRDNIGKFWQVFPTDTIRAQGQTEIRMAYDDTYFYVGVKCYSKGGDFVIPSLRRDYRFPGNDNITLMLDTYNDKTNAFIFGLNPYGVQREAIVSNGGRQSADFSGSWDNKWLGEARRYEDYWTAEFAIPFKTLRYQEGGSEWRFNCYRNDTQFNEWSAWTNIPRNRLVMDVSFMGPIIWQEPLKKAGSNISLIPYATAGAFRDFEDIEQNQTQTTADIGGDAKIAVTSGLNLDLTANPDFSQVEVDQQVTNLDRFEILLPERRQFFLENADLFSSFGLRRVNPFFSRRIGVSIDTATGQNIQNAILYGARLSGKLNEKLRLGLLNMQTARQESNGLPGFNYSVAALQHQVFDRSNISFMMVNKQAVNPGGFDHSQFSEFNRVAGLEYRLISSDNRWIGKAYYHQAFTPENLDQKYTHGMQIEYLRRKYRLEYAYSFIGLGFDAQTGFVPRKDYVLFSPEFQVFFYPTNGKINEHSVNVDTRFFFQIGKDEELDYKPAPYTMTERQTEVEWAFQFSDNSRGGLMFTENDLTLLRNFDPTRLQSDTSIYLRAGTRYHFSSLSAEYSSDQRKKFQFSLTPTIGQFYDGFRAGLGGSLTYRYQPYGFISLTWDYNYVKLDDPFEPVSIWLIGPRFDFTFTKKLFLTTFFQYNNQFDNLNINARLQWRFAPVSDFFLVYTDNYLTENFSQFGVRNRGVVAKVTYWLNL